ncbi:MAG: arsenate reductase ArsC [Chlorobiaceae bacterium]|nr:arsenate reductase ArsC [Chlorobiaceae bacterium]NTV61598.1 arsenate reductase ArsC [Chlorobiaceae bacterium]
MERKKNVLILCSGNSARSQMAEGMLRKMAGDRFEVLSAGLEPKTVVHPLAIEVMLESGIDISAQKPKTVEVYLGKTPVHYLIVVCSKAQDTCPRIWPGLMDCNRFYWPLDDPAEQTGTREELLARFRSVRDELEERLREWTESTLRNS